MILSQFHDYTLQMLQVPILGWILKRRALWSFSRPLSPPPAPFLQIQSPPCVSTLCLPAAMHVARSFRPSPSVLVDQKLVGFLSPLRNSSASILCCMASELEPAKKLVKIFSLLCFIHAWNSLRINQFLFKSVGVKIFLYWFNMMPTY